MARIKAKVKAKPRVQIKGKTTEAAAKSWYTRYKKKHGEIPEVANAPHGEGKEALMRVHQRYLDGKAQKSAANAIKRKATSRQDVKDKTATKAFKNEQIAAQEKRVASLENTIEGIKKRGRESRLKDYEDKLFVAKTRLKSMKKTGEQDPFETLSKREISALKKHYSAKEIRDMTSGQRKDAIKDALKYSKESKLEADKLKAKKLKKWDPEGKDKALYDKNVASQKKKYPNEPWRWKGFLTKGKNKTVYFNKDSSGKFFWATSSGKPKLVDGKKFYLSQGQVSSYLKSMKHRANIKAMKKIKGFVDPRGAKGITVTHSSTGVGQAGATWTKGEGPSEETAKLARTFGGSSADAGYSTRTIKGGGKATFGTGEQRGPYKKKGEEPTKTKRKYKRRKRG